MDVRICVPCHLPQLRSGQRLQPEPEQGWNPALVPGQTPHPARYQVAVEGWREMCWGKFSWLRSSCVGEAPSARTRGEGEATNGVTESRQGHGGMGSGWHGSSVWNCHGMDPRCVSRTSPALLHQPGIPSSPNSPQARRLDLPELQVRCALWAVPSGKAVGVTPSPPLSLQCHGLPGKCLESLCLESLRIALHLALYLLYILVHPG